MAPGMVGSTPKPTRAGGPGPAPGLPGDSRVGCSRASRRPGAFPPNPSPYRRPPPDPKPTPNHPKTAPIPPKPPKKPLDSAPTCSAQGGGDRCGAAEATRGGARPQNAPPLPAPPPPLSGAAPLSPTWPPPAPARPLAPPPGAWPRPLPRDHAPSSQWPRPPSPGGRAAQARCPHRAGGAARKMAAAALCRALGALVLSPPRAAAVAAARPVATAAPAGVLAAAAGRWLSASAARCTTDPTWKCRVKYTVRPLGMRKTGGRDHTGGHRGWGAEGI
ncbi:39S ribosomal protein L2, mitochondrial [Aix galericulata]|nr:39S ribosomal protein L2, mitochondrial [Aix galericulata]